jgi:hypothetical protein
MRQKVCPRWRFAAGAWPIERGDVRCEEYGLLAFR